MPTTYSLLIRGTRTSQSAQQKIIAISYAVVGVTDPTAAMNYVMLTIPAGTPCSYDSNCLATSYDVESLDQSSEDTCRIVVNFVGYSFYGSPVIGGPTTAPLSYSYGGALNSDLTNYNYGDPNFTPLQVYWWANPANIGTPAVANLKNGAVVPVLKPYDIKTVSFFMIATDFPSSVINTLQAYLGKCNSDTWDSGAPYSWLCTNIQAQPVGLPQQLRVDCVFQYKLESWLAWAFIKNGTSNPPDGTRKNINDPGQTVPTTGSNGCAGFTPYGTVNFASSFGFG